MVNKFCFHVSISDEEIKNTSYEDLKRKVHRAAEASFADMYLNALRESIYELECTKNEAR